MSLESAVCCRLAKTAILALGAASLAGACAPSAIKVPPYDPLAHRPPADATRETITGSIGYDYDGSYKGWASVDHGTLMTWIDSSKIFLGPKEFLWDGELDVEGKRFAFQAIITEHQTPANPDSTASLVVTSWAWSDSAGHVVERGTATPSGIGTGSFALIRFLTPSGRTRIITIDDIDMPRCVMPRDGAVTGRLWELSAYVGGATCAGVHENSLTASISPRGPA